MNELMQQNMENNILADGGWCQMEDGVRIFLLRFSATDVKILLVKHCLELISVGPQGLTEDLLNIFN